MPAANQILHGSICGWIRELDEANGRIEWPPTHKWGGEALIAAHMALLQAVETSAASLSVTPNPAVDVLKEVHAIWGGPSEEAVPKEQPSTAY
jgi:hypothetical protein